jgi:hypothetical protein
MADLASTVRDLLRQANLREEEVDTSALSGWLPGMVLSARTSLRDVLETLQAFFQWDVVESDGKLCFRPRGRASVAAINDSECLLINEAPGEAVSITRLPALKLPEQVDVVYHDKDADYQPGTQSALRQLAPPQSSPDTLRVPLSLNASQARRQAQLLLDAAWAERLHFRFALPPRYLALEAGDVVTLTINGTPWVIRLLRVLVHNGWLQCEGVSSEASAYTQTATGAVRSTNPGVIATGSGTFVVLDLPLVDESDDSAGYFFAVGKQREDRYWRFASVYRSLDNLDYTPSVVLTSEAIMGTSTTVLSGNAPTAFWDKANTVTVAIADGSLFPTSNALLLNGANTCVLGQEILQFGNAELVGTFTYKLSNLLRGRRGTEHAMGTHALGERFILLGSEVLRQPADTLGAERFFKSVPNGQILDEQTAISFTPQGISLKPFAPVHVRASRASNGDMTLSWIRRTRRHGLWLSGSDVPLAEESEQYDVEILNGATVLRTFSTTTPTVLYTTTQQQADFGVVPGSVAVRVYQRSAIVGRGYGASAVV